MKLVVNFSFRTPRSDRGETIPITYQEDDEAVRARDLKRNRDHEVAAMATDTKVSPSCRLATTNDGVEVTARVLPATTGTTGQPAGIDVLVYVYYLKRH